VPTWATRAHSTVKFRAPGQGAGRQFGDQHGGGPAGAAQRLRRLDSTRAVRLVVGDVLETYRGLENTDSGDDRVSTAGRGRSRSTSEPMTSSPPPSGHSSTPRNNRVTPAVDDLHGDRRTVWRPSRLNVVSGSAQNTGIAYLTEQVRRRPKLTIQVGPRRTRVLFSGRTATGVRTADGTVLPGGQIICQRVPTAARPSCFGPDARPRSGRPLHRGLATSRFGNHLQDQPINAFTLLRPGGFHCPARRPRS